MEMRGGCARSGGWQVANSLHELRVVEFDVLPHLYGCCIGKMLNRLKKLSVRRILLPAQHDVNKMNLPPPPGPQLHNCHIGTLPKM